MASKKSLNESNLEALGATRLAELLIEISAGNAAAKRRLRLELAGIEGPREAANEIRKRLTTIARSRTFVDWEHRKALVEDLESLRCAITNQVGRSDPVEGEELMWRFLDLANSVFERCDDSSGTVISIFHTACGDLGNIALLAKSDPKDLASRTYQALIKNDYGQFDELIAELTSALGQEGLEHLKQLMIALSKEQVRRPAEKERNVIGFGSGGPIYADEVAERSRISTVRMALTEISDAQGDVDAFIAQYDEQARKAPMIAAAISRRLLAASRAQEAWQVIEATQHRQNDWPKFDWEDARIDVLDALGRRDEAQAARWSCFERFLSARHLRSHLKRLPDFEDLEAEERALAHGEQYKDVLQAIAFLVSWPALDRAARTMSLRAGELDGDHFEILTPAAEALAGKYPLAATVALRAMIDFSLTKGRSTRYSHAARHLTECESLASRIPDFGAFEAHDAYVRRLRREHGRKTSFWSLIPL